MKNITMIAALAATLGLGTGHALADHHGGLEEAFKAADKDADGTLDKEEAGSMPHVAKHFDAIDADKDGTVDMQEIAAGMKGMMGKKMGAMHEKGGAMFAAADKDGDGTLDREEAKAMPRIAKNFDALDTDKDGTLDKEEIAAGMKGAMGKRMGAMHQKGGAMFAAADKDGDGTLDRDEAKAMKHVSEQFDMIDTDKDGTVSLEEIHAYMQNHRHGK